MVFAGDSIKGVRDLVMALPPERSKLPLHNFDLPCLKWGNQRHLRCIKVAVKDKNLINCTSADRGTATRSPPPKFAVGRNYQVRRFKKLETDPSVYDTGVVEEGIDAVREKLMCDFKAAADKLKASLLRKGLSDESDDEDATQYCREQEEEDGEKEKSPPVSESAAAVVVGTGEEARPWNLRKRRAASKAPVGGNSVNVRALIEERRASNHSPARSGSSKSPAMLRGDKRDKEKEIEQPRSEFSVVLSRKEIEADFMEMLRRKPRRRPKKRPRNVQNQLDMLFPGGWLTEVTVGTYKVPEHGKR